MALDSLNAAAAAAILSQAKVDSATKTRGVIVSAFVPGPLGVAVRVIMARNARSLGGAGGGGGGGTPGTNLVMVPDVVTGHIKAGAATDMLTAKRLVADPEPTFGDDADIGFVVAQDPPAATRVPLDSEVTIFVGAGKPPPDTTDTDLDTDLTNKINQAVTTLTAKLNEIENKISAMGGGSGATGTTGATGATGATGSTGATGDTGGKK